MKKIIIIGASSGLGMRIATDFARMGWRVGVAARREEPLKALHDLYPAQVAYHTIDVRTVDAVERFNHLIEFTDGMDVLLFASGIGFADPDLRQSKLIDMLETNVVGFARILAEAYKYFRRTATDGAGQIAAITSVAATKGIGVAAGYSSSKRFQQTFIDSLEQLAHRQAVDVKFTDIRPGFVRTPLLDTTRSYPMIMSVDYVAPLIEEAILRKRRVAYIDWRWGLLTGAWRLMPQWLWARLPVSL